MFAYTYYSEHQIFEYTHTPDESIQVDFNLRSIQSHMECQKKSGTI